MWEKYFKFFKNVLPYLGIIVIIRILIALIGEAGIKLVLHTSISEKVIDIITLLFVIAGWVLGSIVMIAMMRYLHKEISETPTVRWNAEIAMAKKYFLPFAVLSLIFGLIIAFGSVLFIIPGIIFFVWYYFAIYHLILNDKKILSGLPASKELVVGRWWSVALRLIIPKLVFIIIGWLVYVAVFAIIQIVFKPSTLTSIMVNQSTKYIIMLLYTPAIILSDLILFKDLLENKTGVVVK